MGRRRKRRLHARPTAGSQPPPPLETSATASVAGDVEHPRSDGVGSASTTVVGRCSKRPGVTDSVPEKDKRRKLENNENEMNDDGETTEEDEQNTTTDVNLKGSDRNGSDEAAGGDPVKSDLDGTDRNGSDPVEDDPVVREATDEYGSNRVGSSSVDNNGGEGGEGGGVRGDPGSQGGDAETSIVVTCGKNEGRLYLYKLRVVVSERCRSKCIRTGNTWWTPNEFQFVSGRGAAKDWKRTVKHAGRCLKALLASGTLCLSSTPPRCLCESCTTQVSGKTAADESDDIGRNINDDGGGEDGLSNGKPAQDASNIRNKGIKRRRPIKRHIKGNAADAVPLHGGDKSVEPVPVPSKKRRKLVRNVKPEAHSDSTVSLSADVIFESGTGSGVAEEGGAKSGDDVSRTVVASVPEPPPPPAPLVVVVKRRRGRPKKKPTSDRRKTATKVKVKVKVSAEKDSISDRSASLIDGCCPDDEEEVTRASSELPQVSPDGQRRRTGSAGDGCDLPENRSNRLNDEATIIPPLAAPPLPTSASRASSSPEPSEAAAAAIDELTSTNDVPLLLPRVPPSHSNSISIVDQSPETDAPPSSGAKLEQENVVIVDTSTNHNAASDPLPVCPSDETLPSGDAHAPDADLKPSEDDVTVSGDVKDDVKKGSSPVRNDDVTTETSLVEPRRKNAYLNAVIAELKRKKISRETSSGTISSTGAKDHHQHQHHQQQHHQQQQQQQHHQQHQRTRHPSDLLLQPTTDKNSHHAVSLIKSEPSPESKSISDALIRDFRSPLSGGGLTTSSSPSSFRSSSDPLSLAFVPSSSNSIVDGKPLSCLKPSPLNTDRKDDVAPYADVRSGSGSRRTDWRTTTSDLRGGTPLPPMPDFPHAGEAAFWRHLPSMIGTPEGKGGGGGDGGGKQQPGGVGGRSAADMSSPLSMSQLASICGLSQSQLASLPFPPPQFSLYPPYLFMGFPLQPLLPEFQSAGSHPPSPAGAAGAASTTTTTGGHSSIKRPPSHPLPPPASTSASAPSNAPSSQQHHQQQQQPRRRRSHHHHHCKSSSSSASSSSASGPPKDPLFRHPPSDPHHAASYSALRKTDSMPTNQSAALLTELNRWRSCAPGLLSSQPWTGTTTKSSSPNKFSPTGSSVQERKLWRPAAAIASSAKEYSPAAYESIVPSRPPAHAPVTCRSYGDTSLAAHAHRFDSSVPVDFTRRLRARDEVEEEEERKYSSAITGSGEYPCDEQGVLDLSKK